MGSSAFRQGCSGTVTMAPGSSRPAASWSTSMKTLQLAMAGLAALGAALVAAPEPAQAGYGYGYGYGWPSYGYSYYRRPVRKVVVVERPYYPIYRRPYVRPAVVVNRSFYGRPYRPYHYGYRW
jgi:hypothetical protein